MPNPSGDFIHSGGPPGSVSSTEYAPEGVDWLDELAEASVRDWLGTMEPVRRNLLLAEMADRYLPEYWPQRIAQFKAPPKPRPRRPARYPDEVEEPVVNLEEVA